MDDITGSAIQDPLTGGGTGFNSSNTKSGEGTYYNQADFGLGNCGFESVNTPFYAALNSTDYAGSDACGAILEVTGPKGTVNVQVVDSCPECAPGDVDLSPDAFAQIADLSAGRVPITWRIASSDVDSSIVYHFKDGTNPNYTAVQIRNSNNPIASVEYLDSDGQFKYLERTEFNYFVSYNGLGSNPLTLEVTDVYGNTIVDNGISPIANSDFTSDEQFPTI